MQDPIPSNGAMLTAVSNFWLEKLKHIPPNQFTGDTSESVVKPEEAEQVRDAAIRLYQEADDYAATKAIIVADTKFEFGQNATGKLYLIDEAADAGFIALTK